MRYHLTDAGLQDLTMSSTKLLYALFVGEGTSHILNVEPVMAKLLDHPNIIFKLPSTKFNDLTLSDRNYNLQQNMFYMEPMADELANGQGILLYSIQLTNMTDAYYGNYVEMEGSFYSALTRRKLIDDMLPTL